MKSGISKIIKLVIILSIYCSMACNQREEWQIQIFETSANGNQLSQRPILDNGETDAVTIQIHPDEKFQTILGIGGSFTEASAYLLNQLSDANRNQIMEAYFGDSGARYSLTRTHINSCDFSLGNYSYAPIAGDVDLEHFSIDEDRDDLIPMIKEALKISSEGFKIISSPWTAPPWMKDNQSYVGGKLLPEFYPTWARFFSKYIKAYETEGIEIWGITVENEPLGNDNNWESMHYTPEEMNDFVKNHLGPQFKNDNLDVKIMGYDQNRDEELYEWVDAMFDDKDAARFYDGTAVHWYASTFDYFPDALNYANQEAPDKYLIQTEACVDNQVPVWKDDAWYWSKEATDWGWDWAPEDKKHLHPKYVPVFRYARDIIGCLNHHVNGWVDWNMVLDRQGGPNWFENWCVAPVIVDIDLDEVYFTPLYYVMAHFSRFIRPGAQRIGFQLDQDSNLKCTVVENPDHSIAMVLLNQEDLPQNIRLMMGKYDASFTIDGKAVQTIILQKY